jgi:hypothetical protein
MDIINVIITYLDEHDWAIVVILAVVSGLSFLYFRKKDSVDKTIDISIDMAPKKEKTIALDSKKKDIFKVDYIMNKNNQHTQIIPKLQYLELIKKNEQVSAVNMNKSMISLSPCIYIKITNNTETTLKIDKLKFNIDYSKPIEKPLPVFNYLDGGKPFEVIIQNLGWGEMLNTSLEFDFYLNEDDNIGLSKKSEKLIRNIGTIDTIKHIDISDIFKENWKFDIDYLSGRKIVTEFIDARRANISDNDGEKFIDNFFNKIFTAYGDLQHSLFDGHKQFRLRVYMRGKIYYKYKLNNQIYDAKPINFITPIKLCNKVAAGPIEPNIQSIYTLELELNKENYSLIIDDAYAIKSGDTEVIEVTLNNEQSSKHKMHITADRKQGNLNISNDILLEIFKFKDNK